MPVVVRLQGTGILTITAIKETGIWYLWYIHTATYIWYIPCCSTGHGLVSIAGADQSGHLSRTLITKTFQLGTPIVGSSYSDSLIKIA